MTGEQRPARFVFKLYNVDRSRETRILADRLEEVLTSRFQGGAKVEVIDVVAEPERAVQGKVFVTPTLVKELPEPIARVIGDLSDPRKVLLLLGLVVEDR